MALDRTLLEEGEGFILRFLSWKERSITLGCHENPERSLNLGYAREQGIAIARRPTGGRAVYHHSNESEITFSIACPRRNPLFDDSIRSAFEWVSSLVGKALEAEGVDLHKHAVDQQSHKSGNACFDSALKYEISVHGFKVFGSAQKRTPSRLLVQSTLLLKGSGETGHVLNAAGEMKGVCDFHPTASKQRIMAGIEDAFLAKERVSFDETLPSRDYDLTDAIAEGLKEVSESIRNKPSQRKNLKSFIDEP